MNRTVGPRFRIRTFTCMMLQYGSQLTDLNVLITNGLYFYPRSDHSVPLTCLSVRLLREKLDFDHVQVCKGRLLYFFLSGFGK